MKFYTEVKNSQIELTNIHLDLSEYGIYLLKGENGSGKSSLVKKLIFGNNKVEFNCAEHEKAYHKNRCELISYVEQDVLPYKTTVLNYVCKSNKEEDKEKLFLFLEKFGISDIDLHSNVEKLSGGELVKLNIIAALLKNTPFIFMDEPTNNLDNPSVRAFVSVIEELSQDYTFLIVSHDPRLNFKHFSEIEIIDNELKIISKFNTEKNLKTVARQDYPKTKLIWEYFRSPYSFIAASGILMLLAICFFVNLTVYMSMMNLEDISQVQDVIVTYKTDMQYEELNQNYVKYEKLDIDEAKQYKMIYFDDLEQLNNREDIEKIIIPNTEYIDQLVQEMQANNPTAGNEVVDHRAIKEEGGTLQELPILAVPDEILNNFGDQLLLPCDVRMLKKGRLPKNNADEVVISEDLLFEQYHIKAGNGVGSKILIKNREYEVVGIGYFDLCLVSFCDEIDYGYFVYENDLSETKIDALKEYLEKEDYYMTNGVFNTIIYTKKNCERSILNYLITTYPAENYVSKEFETSYQKYINRNGTVVLYLANILMAILFSFIVLSLLKKSIFYQKNKARSYDNYFCARSRTIRMFLCSGYSFVCVCYLLLLIFTGIAFPRLIPYLLVNSLVSFIMNTIGMRKGRI